MSERPFQQVDVFTAVPFKGNPVAVVLEGDGLSVEQMQAIALWTNLSETTFLCAPADPAADYRLRIFTPKSELPFAGHPTIGSAHAALRHGLRPKADGRIVQECGRGLVEIEREGDRLFFALPTPRFDDERRVSRKRLSEALGTGESEMGVVSIIDVGPVWLTAQLASADAVIALRPDMRKIGDLLPAGMTGVTVFGAHRAGSPAAFEVRSFGPGEGVPEDPVCGSGNGCVAALVQREGLVAGREYLARQGRCLGRDGQVAVRFAGDGRIWVGGQAVTCVEGTLMA